MKKILYYCSLMLCVFLLLGCEKTTIKDTTENKIEGSIEASAEDISKNKENIKNKKEELVEINSIQELRNPWHKIDLCWDHTGCKIFWYYDKNNSRQWKRVSYYRNWNKHLEWNFIDDERDGVRNMYYENGQLRTQWKYKKWKENWPWKERYRNGAKQSYQVFNVWVSIQWKRWYESGELSVEWEINEEWKITKWKYKEGQEKILQINKNNGTNSTINKERYLNWQLKRIETWEDYVQNGDWKWWYENGQIKFEWKFKDWYRDDFWKFWNENWQLKAEWKYVKWEEVWIWK